MIYAIVAIVVVVFFVIFFFSCYTVVSANQAHVVVTMGRGRRIISPVKKDGIDGNTSYFYVPIFMKRYILTLSNVKIDILNIPLNDLEVAPFLCDVITWLRIEDPVLAAERLDLSSENVFQSLHSDLTAIVQAVARAASMKMELLDLMRDRTTFSKSVSSEVDIILKGWGVALTNLEINDIRDADGSEIIQNYETIRKAAIESKTRIEIAQRDREAIEQEQSNRQLAEVSKANAEKTFITAQIERDTAVGIANQEKEQSIAVAEQKTNEKKVSALRTSQVGQAEIAKEASIVRADGEGEAIRIRGEKEAAVVTLKGKADGNAIEFKGLAEAKAKDAMAEALKKYNDAGINLEKIKASVTVQQAYAEAYSKIAEKANIKIVSGGEGGNILGLPITASTGASFGQMLEAFGTEKISEVIEAVKKS